jgi:protein ImuA
LRARRVTGNLFSNMALSLPLADLISLLGSRIESAESLGRETASSAEAGKLSLDWPELDAALPDGGLPRGVVELAAPRALGGGASIAFAAVRAAQARNPRAWCAWVDPESTLYAPGLVGGGVDLTRLLVVRPPRGELARVAVKVAASRAFDVIAIDMDPVPGAVVAEPARTPRPRKRAWPSEVLVRKLALLAAEGGATILLLTDRAIPRAVPWPVALRLELTRSLESIALRVAKDRRGRGGLVKTVPFETRPGALGWRHGHSHRQTG